MISQITRVWLARHVVDFRCGHEGLIAHAKKVGISIESGDGILFIARDKKKLKLLFADDNGIWVGYKKFYKKGLKINIQFFDSPNKSKLLKSELKMLLSGASYVAGNKIAPWP